MSLQSNSSHADENYPSFNRNNNSNIAVFPGFCDVHVHLREPGFSYKETIASGTRAAARGGYTAVCTMPNLKPVPDSIEHMAAQSSIINDSACINVYPYASISVGELGEQLSDMDGLAANCFAFSDDGRGVQSESLMREAMRRASALGKLIVAHCEVNSLLNKGYIHDGAYASANGHRGISSESEWKQIARDVRLSEETGCAYHVCHISTKEGVEIIRQAKAKGLNVSCEVTPHHLLLDENDMQEDGRFKMNPPLRSAEDREALIRGIQDGTIEIIATDHAPHSAEEKARGLEGSAMGVVGLETAFPLLYTGLVREGIISLERLVELMAINPRKRFGLKTDEESTGLCTWDLGESYVIDSREFLSMGKATPFEGMRVYGRCLETKINNNIAYKYIRED